MVRPIRPVGGAFFRNAPQIGKRFFYSLVPQANGVTAVIDRNTVINYECTLFIGKADLESLIRDMTGATLPGAANGYDYHLDKQAGIFDGNFLGTINVPNSIGNYVLTSVAVAASHNGIQARGNILIVFNQPNGALMDEIVISIHINGDRNINSNYVQKKATVAHFINGAVKALRLNHSIYTLMPSDFKRLGYTVTHGHNEAAAYDAALEAALIAQLFAELSSI